MIFNELQRVNSSRYIVLYNRRFLAVILKLGLVVTPAKHFFLRNLGELGVAFLRDLLCLWYQNFTNLF